LAQNTSDGHLHKKNVEKTLRNGIEAMSSNHPSFVLLHFGIPHWPFVFDASGYNPGPDPYLLNDENYTNQLEYVDRLFGQFLEKMMLSHKDDGSAIILMADHNYHALRKAKWRRIPLIVKRKYQQERRDFHEAVNAVDIIREVIVTRVKKDAK